MNDRTKTIGASEIGAILGVNPYMSPVDVWMVKTLRKPEFEGNAATERGLILEPAIAAWFKNHSKFHSVSLNVTMGSLVDTIS